MSERQRTRLDNAINATILAGTAPLCVTWTVTNYAKNYWNWITSQPGH